ncbi:MAG: hypothetical protein AB1798_01860 [Spirochaetota bacterium]
MEKKARVVYILISLIVTFSAILAGACKSIPLPNSPQESLLVVPYEIDSSFNNGEIKITSIQMILKNWENQKERFLILNPGRFFTAIALEPGGYFISKLVVSCQHVKGGFWQDKHNFSGSFYMEKNVVRYFEKSFYVTADKTGGYRFGYNTLPYEKLKEKYLKTLQADSHWLAWENLKLVNF